MPTPGIWKARKKTRATRLNQRVSQEPEKGKIILVNSIPSSSKITNILFWDRSAKSDTELSGNGSASGGEADAENKEGGEEQLEGLVLPNQRDRVLRQQGAEHQDQSCRDVEQAEGFLLLVSEPVQHGDGLVDDDDDEPVHHSSEEDAEPSGNKADEDSKVAGELLRDVVAKAGRVKVDHDGTLPREHQALKVHQESDAFRIWATVRIVHKKKDRIVEGGDRIWSKIVDCHGQKDSPDKKKV